MTAGALPARAGSLAGWLVHEAPPSSASVVMATGIVSAALHLDGHEDLSLAFLGIAALTWLVIVCILVVRLATRHERLGADARALGALTLVAGTAVLAGRLDVLGWPGVALVLGALALALWLFLLPSLAIRASRRAAGLTFLLTVSTQSVAVVAALLAVHYLEPWLVLLALALCGLGLVLYAVGLLCFHPRLLRTGTGEIWIAGGALAISALACARIAEATESVRDLAGLHGALDTLALAVWAAAIAWLPVLVLAELRWRRLGYEPMRWATVFPLGMYAAMGFAVASTDRIGGIADFSRWWIWLALAVWCLTALGLARRAVRLARRTR